MTNVMNGGGRTSTSTHKELETAIERLAADTRAPDGSLQRTLSVDHTLQVARQFGVSTKTVELTALEIEILPLRYQRNQKTLNLIELKQLLKSKAVIVGLGGLGGTVTEILARANVGHLVLVDGDCFEDHNLNRQLLCTQDRLGASKARVAADRVAAVNSAIEVEYHQTPIDEGNRLDIIAGSQVVVDCLDNIPDRFMLQAATRQAGIVLVSAAVAGLCGQVTTVFPEDKGLELIFGPPRIAMQSPKGIETEQGCLPQAVSLIAAIEAAEAIKVLLGQTGQLLRNKLLFVDLSRNSFDILGLG